MNPDILIVPIVLLAVLYLVQRYRNRGKVGSAGCSCDSCPSSGDCGSVATPKSNLESCDKSTHNSSYNSYIKRHK